MGRGEARTPTAFTRAIQAYVRHRVETEGGEASGRWLAARLSRVATYYRDRIVGEKAFDTNDIGDLAALFGMSPQAFVRAAIAHSMSPVADTTIRRIDELALAAKHQAIDAEEEGDHIP